MILNWGKTRIPLFLAGSHTDYPTHAMIGSGSGTVNATQTELIYPADRQAITVANDSTAYKVKYITDWNAVELSGLDPVNGFHLTEWGMCINKAGLTGSLWSRTTMPTAIIFEGTTELRVQETWNVY